MRLDHLLSKEEKVRVVLLFGYQVHTAKDSRSQEQKACLLELGEEEDPLGWTLIHREEAKRIREGGGHAV